MAKSTLRFRDSASACERLAAEITARRFAPLYLLMGEEGYFIDLLADLLAGTVLDEADREFGQNILYGRDTSAEEVIELCRQLPMAGDCRVVIVREAQQMRGIERLGVYAQKPAPTAILVICHKEKSVDKRSTLYKGAAAHGAVLESVRPRDYEIGPWLAEFIRRRGTAIDDKALAMLVEHLGTDIAKISNELDKLLVSLPEGCRRITDADIETHIGISREYNNFELCRALLLRDSARTLAIADHFSRNPREYPLLLTVAALFSQFRNLFRLNYLQWQARHKGIPFPPDGELLRILRLNNTYALNELKSAVRLWPNRTVFGVLGLLREYDARSKGQGGGGTDGELLRELLLRILRS